MPSLFMIGLVCVSLTLDILSWWLPGTRLYACDHTSSHLFGSNHSARFDRHRRVCESRPGTESGCIAMLWCLASRRGTHNYRVFCTVCRHGVNVLTFLWLWFTRDVDRFSLAAAAGLLALQLARLGGFFSTVLAMRQWATGLERCHPREGCDHTSEPGEGSVLALVGLAVDAVLGAVCLLYVGARYTASPPPRGPRSGAMLELPTESPTVASCPMRRASRGLLGNFFGPGQQQPLTAPVDERRVRGATAE